MVIIPHHHVTPQNSSPVGNHVPTVTFVTFVGSSSGFVLKIGHPEITLPVTASLEYHSIDVPTVSTVSTVPSCLTSAVEKLHRIMQGICKLSTLQRGSAQKYCMLDV